MTMVTIAITRKKMWEDFFSIPQPFGFIGLESQKGCNTPHCSGVCCR